MNSLVKAKAKLLHRKKPDESFTDGKQTFEENFGMNVCGRQLQFAKEIARYLSLKRMC